MRNNQGLKTEDARILGQTQAEILAVNDLCPDESHKKAMRGIIMSALDRMFYRLREFYADNPDGHGPRRNNNQSK